MSASVAVLGAGGHARVVISALRAGGSYDAMALFDDDEDKWGSAVDGVEVRGPMERAVDLGFGSAVVAIGDNRTREELVQVFDFDWITLVHPDAWLDPSVRLGAGTVVFAGVVVQPGTTIGSHAIVNTGAIVDHDCLIADFVHVGPGTTLAGSVSVGEGSLLGVGSTVMRGVTIGAWSTLGAGGLATTDLPSAVAATGVPARVCGRA